MAVSGKRGSIYLYLDDLRQQFDSLDAGKTGQIGFNELTKLVKNMPGVEDSAVPELMERLDRDKDGMVTFEDFKILFEAEHEARKKARANTSWSLESDSESSPYHHTTSENDLSQNSEYNTALETLPSLSEILASPSHNTKFKDDLVDDDVTPESPKVVLRHKRLGRSVTLPSKLSTPLDTGLLSPIHSGRTPARGERPGSNEFPDLASQLKYLTPGGEPQLIDSPQLKRGSKVLSWISETEDLLFEDTGTEMNRDTKDGFGSPPMSPTRGNDEASIVKSILESVCHSSDIGRDSIVKLCEHVKADPQEEEELIGLLEHLDHENKGHVSLDEFVHGLQAVRNAAVVTSTPPPSVQRASLRRTYSEQLTPPPHSSQKFSTPIAPKHPGPALMASTPMPPASLSKTDTGVILSVLDPETSGYVKVDRLVSQWHNLGVDPAQYASLENALREAISVDQAGRVNVLELTTLLEGAILSEESKQTVLRQVALHTFKSEIATLRSQVNQVSLERDKIKNTLNRTLEENKKLVKEGDEHVDLVTKHSERKLKEKEALMSEKLKEVEKSRQEEALQIQDRAATMISKLRSELETLKGEEENLRLELRIVQEELQDTTDKLSAAHADLVRKEKTIAILQRGLGNRSEYDLLDSDGQLSHLQELKQELTEKGAIVNDLRDKLRETQDKYDLLVSDNEKLKQKYMAQKRVIQRRKSTPIPETTGFTSVKKRHSTGDRPRRLNRPLSGSLYGRSRPIRPHPLSYNLDLAVEGSHHPVLYEEQGSETNFLEEPVSAQEKHDLETEYLSMHQDSDNDETQSSPASSDEIDRDGDDLLTKSSASLMEELQYDQQRSMLEEKIKKLKLEKATLEKSYQNLEEQLRTMEEAGLKDELYHELEKNKSKQEELEKYILSLERQCESLNATRSKIDSQLTNAEEFIMKQLQDIRSLRNLTNASDGQLGVLLSELDRAHSMLEEEKSNHEKSIALLKGEISKLEEYSDSQTDQCLKLEEEKAQMLDDMAFLRQLHKKEMESLSQDLDKSQTALTMSETKREEKFEKVQKDLENARQSIASYEQQVEDLRTELNKVKNSIVSKSGVEPLESAVAVVRTSSEQSQEEFAIVSEKNEKLRKELEMYQTRLTECEQKAKMDVADLQTQLVETQKELSDQSDLYSSEIARLKEDQENEQERNKRRIEILLTEAQDIHLQEMETINQRYQAEIESIHKQLRDAEENEEILKGRLLTVGAQYEDSLSKIGDLTENESMFQYKIAELESSHQKQREEISQLTVDLGLVQSELDELKSRNQQLLEVDFSSPPQTRSPSRTRSFDSSLHEEIISQMKSQLEELQQSLVLHGKSDGGSEADEELALIKGLIAGNETLDAEIAKMKRDIAAEHAKYSETLCMKNSEIVELQSKIEKEKKAFEALTLATARKLLSKINSLQDDSDESLQSFKTRIEAAASKLGGVGEFLRERDARQTNALDRLLTDLDQSQSTLFGYKDEVERLQAELNKSYQENLNLSMQKVEREDAVDGAIDDPQEDRSPHHIVDVESGQLITSNLELDERLTQTSELQRKEEEIQLLRKEIEKCKQQEKLARNFSDELTHELQETKASLRHQENELQHQLTKNKELERQLLSVTEPVKNTQSQPLENEKNSEAIESLRLQHIMTEMEAKHDAEMTALNQVIEEQTKDVQELYKSLASDEAVVPQTHSELVMKCGQEIEKLKLQVAEEKTKCLELQSTLEGKIKEHDQLDAQFELEHEEEVKALRQQKDQLQRQIEEMKVNYHEVLTEQEEQNNLLLQDLVNNKDSIERHLKDKTEELFHVYQQVADLTEEKKVLMDIIHQLCLEVGRQIDVV